MFVHSLGNCSPPSSFLLLPSSYTGRLTDNYYGRLELEMWAEKYEVAHMCVRHCRKFFFFFLRNRVPLPRGGCEFWERQEKKPEHLLGLFCSVEWINQSNGSEWELRILKIKTLSIGLWLVIANENRCRTSYGESKSIRLINGTSINCSPTNHPTGNEPSKQTSKQEIYRLQ